MLDPKEEQLLEETYRLGKENNAMIQTLYKNMWWGRAFRIFYWMVFIILMVGSYYYAQPYIESFVKIYNNVTTMVPGLKQ